MRTLLLANLLAFITSVVVAAQEPATVPALVTQNTTFATIQGTALSSTNGDMAASAVRLRDARTGRIVARQLTSPKGSFAFRVDPGSYVVELLDENDMVLAASTLVNANAGEVASTVVRLPFKIPPFGGLLGHTATEAAVITSAAAAAGVLAVDVAGQCASPPCQ
jgi:hypothetical protein